MQCVKKGVIVTLNYTGRLQDGTVFDSTLGGPAMEFTIGDGQVMQAFEQAILGMRPGETKTVRLAPEDCYGLRQAELVVAVPRSKLPADVELQVGQRVNVAAEGQAEIAARIVDIDHSQITLDANHPMAGETLTYEIAVLEVTPP